MATLARFNVLEIQHFRRKTVITVEFAKITRGVSKKSNPKFVYKKKGKQIPLNLTFQCMKRSLLLVSFYFF